MQKQDKQRNGFTMIEIMVVVVIIAILAAFAVPIYIDYVESARASEAKSVISSISNASVMFYQSNGEWPSSVDDLERQGQLDLELSTKLKWQFELQLPEFVTATSTEEMAGGAGKVIQYNRELGKYTGYGTPEQE